MSVEKTSEDTGEQVAESDISAITTTPKLQMINVPADQQAVCGPDGCSY